MQVRFRSARLLLIGVTLVILVAVASYAAVHRLGGVPAASAQTSFADPQLPFIDDIRAQLLQERFDLLDQTAKDLWRSKARFPGGDWKLYRFYGALGQPTNGERGMTGAVVASDEVWERYLAVLGRWQTKRPQSMSAAISLGQAWAGYAWKARGGGYAATVTDGGARLFKERLEHAEDVLTNAQRFPVKDSHWYFAMLELGLAQGWDRARIEAVFEEAVALEPLYLPVYSSKAAYLLPRWYGEAGDWERFADESAKRIGGEEGSVLSGRIAWRMSRMYSGSDFFKQNRINWDRLKQGFIDREALYGTDLRLLNIFCLLADSAGDTKTSRELFMHIADAWDPQAWTQRRYFDAARGRALGLQRGPNASVQVDR